MTTEGTIGARTSQIYLYFCGGKSGLLIFRRRGALGSYGSRGGATPPLPALNVLSEPTALHFSLLHLSQPIHQERTKSAHSSISPAAIIFV
jgi:hypothetical protein